MLAVICWKWRTPGYRSTFGPATVNTLARMVRRHYPHPHVVKCVTDQPEGIDADIEIVPDWNDFADLPAPNGGKNPSCYRRLRAFHPEIGRVFGPRFVTMDLDCVITGDLTPLWHRPEDFVIYGDTNPRTFFNGSMILMTAGARPQVWEQFDPERSPREAKAAGHHGSDQGWISHCLGPREVKWSKADGVYSFRNHLRQQPSRLPANARLVVFHGSVDPWSPAAQQLPWVKQHYQ